MSEVKRWTVPAKMGADSKGEPIETDDEAWQVAVVSNRDHTEAVEALSVRLDAEVSAHAATRKRLEAERDEAIFYRSELDRTFGEVFEDWATVKPPFGVPLRVHLLHRLKADRDALAAKLAEAERELSRVNNEFGSTTASPIHPCRCLDAPAVPVRDREPVDLPGQATTGQSGAGAATSLREAIEAEDSFHEQRAAFHAFCRRCAIDVRDASHWACWWESRQQALAALKEADRG